jgi:hypothetical protein
MAFVIEDGTKNVLIGLQYQHHGMGMYVTTSIESGC